MTLLESIKKGGGRNTYYVLQNIEEKNTSNDDDRLRPINDRKDNCDRLDVKTRILNHINSNHRICKKEIKEIFDIKDAKAKKILKELINKKLIERKGAGRNIYYILHNPQNYDV